MIRARGYTQSTGWRTTGPARFIELSPEEEVRFKQIIESLFHRHLSLTVGDAKFKELIFDVAHVIYEFPFHIPASFNYKVRAMMTLEGIGTQVDPELQLFRSRGVVREEVHVQTRRPLLERLDCGSDSQRRDRQHRMGQGVEAREDGF